MPSTEWTVTMLPLRAPIIDGTNALVTAST